MASDMFWLEIAGLGKPEVAKYVISFKSVFGFFWLVLSWKQGQN